MFWNDPTLYGATLPFRDVPMQTPLTGMIPQHNLQRFIPQGYGFTPMPYFNHIPQYLPYAQLPQFGQVPQFGQLPQLGQVPQFGQLGQLPQYSQFGQMPHFGQFQQVPQMGFNPYMRPIEMNQPFLGWKGQFGNFGC